MKIIDIHTHGIGGYDTRTNIIEDILKIAEIHGSCGVSEIILTIYSSFIKEMRENMEVVKKAIERQKGRSSKKHTKRATIIGIHLEGPFLNPEKCGTLDRRTFIKPTMYNLESLIEGYEDIIKIITIAPEMRDAPKLIKRISDKGIVVSMGHSNATFAEAETGFHSGARGITHIFNAMRGFHHREPGLAGFGLLNKDIYIEVIADPYHLNEKTIDLIFNIKNPKKIIIVSDSIKETKVYSDLHPVKDVNERLAGGSMCIKEASERLIEMGYSKKMIKDCISKNPETYISNN